jgi:hypothetical protein
MLPLLIIVATLATVGIVTYLLVQTNNTEKLNTKTKTNNGSLIPPNGAYLTSSTYCEKNSDCVAVPNPNNSCYKAYFNIYAQAEIEAYRNHDGFMIQDCPYYGPAVCLNHICTGQKN